MAWFLVRDGIKEGMYRPFKIISQLEIEKSAETFLNPKRVRLLKAIREHGSILAASKEVGMSYQQAWTLIREVNTLSPLPIVTRQRGGVKGGGATITPFGNAMLTRYDVIQAQFDRCIEELNEAVQRLCDF